jgi:hypothetical protein
VVIQTSDDGLCDDADLCTGLETCDLLLGCSDPSDLDCDDGNECTADSCDAVTGCGHAAIDGCAVPLPTGQPWTLVTLALLVLGFGAWFLERARLAFR